MRYYYEKPSFYKSIYGECYKCNHPVYNECTLFKIGDKGLAVIQQKFDRLTKCTRWSKLDPWLTNDLYLHPLFKKRKERKLVMAKSYLTLADGLLKVAGDLDEGDPKRLEYTYEALKYMAKAFKLVNC